MHNSDVFKDGTSKLYEGDNDNKIEHRNSQSPRLIDKRFKFDKTAKSTQDLYNMGLLEHSKNGNEDSFYYNYVDQNGKFMNIHEKVDGENYIDVCKSTIPELHEQSSFTQMHKIDQVLEWIRQKELISDKQKASKTQRVKKVDLDIISESENQSNLHFPSISKNIKSDAANKF